MRSDRGAFVSLLTKIAKLRNQAPSELLLIDDAAIAISFDAACVWFEEKEWAEREAEKRKAISEGFSGGLVTEALSEIL